MPRPAGELIDAASTADAGRQFRRLRRHSAIAAACLAVFVVGLWRGGSISTASADGAANRTSAYVLLATRRLLAIAPSGRAQRRLVLGSAGPPPGSAGSRPTHVGDYLAVSHDRSLVFVLLPAGSGQPGKLLAVNAARLTVQHRYSLPESVDLESLTIGPRSGHLYLSGRRNGSDGQEAGSVVVVVVDARSGRVLALREVRKAEGREWAIHSASVSEGEHYLYLSYHGPDTSGADWLSLPGLVPCRGTGSAVAGCLARVHGTVAAYGDHVVATTGEGPILELDRSGRTIKSWPPRIPRNHITELRVDRQAHRIYVIGSCGYSGGLSVIDAARVRVTRIGYPRRVCGERVEPIGPTLVLVAANPLPVVEGTASSILLVDLAKRRVVRRLATASEALDIVASPVP